MFDTPYDFNKVSVDRLSSPDPHTKIHYHFLAKKRKYFVTVELFSFNIAAVKFRDNDHKNSKNAYSVLFNDHDGFRVIGTCIHVMLRIWRDYPEISFAFHASLRTNVQSAEAKEFNEEQLSNYLRSRYNIYSQAMINQFDENHFTHIRDKHNSLYVLLNKGHAKPDECLNRISAYLLANTDVIFEPQSTS